MLLSLDDADADSGIAQFAQLALSRWLQGFNRVAIEPSDTQRARVLEVLDRVRDRLPGDLARELGFFAADISLRFPSK